MTLVDTEKLNALRKALRQLDEIRAQDNSASPMSAEMAIEDGILATAAIVLAARALVKETS